MNFVFDEEKHRYTADGVAVPGITQALKLTGFIDDSWYTSESAERGKAVHLACQFLLEGALDWASVHPEILHRVKSFESFIGEYKPRVLLSEKPLFSSVWRFAGTPDLVAEVNVENWLIDLKSGASGLASKLQTAAQKVLAEENLKIKIHRRFVLSLPAEGSFKLIPHADELLDKNMFLNSVAMVHRRVNEREVSL